MASPKRRLLTNVEGDLFVDDACIDCGTCRHMAPEVFDRRGDHSRVHAQPSSDEGWTRALDALVSCPVAAIGTERRHDVAAAVARFPRLVTERVYHAGFHSPASFGAASYLVVREGGNVLVDSPRFNEPLARRIESMGGVRFMFLTHADDVADHARFAARFGCERILHRRDRSDATRDVERLVEGTDPIELAPDLRILPVPGHTAGSCCLLFEERVLFSGDHLAYRPREDRLVAFDDACWFDWATQLESMRRLASEARFEHVLPGHGAPCAFPVATMAERLADCIRWMESVADRE